MENLDMLYKLYNSLFSFKHPHGVKFVSLVAGVYNFP